jgi:hypothetical protein
LPAEVKDQDLVFWAARMTSFSEVLQVKLSKSLENLVVVGPPSYLIAVPFCHQQMQCEDYFLIIIEESKVKLSNSVWNGILG